MASDRVGTGVGPRGRVSGRKCWKASVGASCGNCRTGVRPVVGTGVGTRVGPGVGFGVGREVKMFSTTEVQVVAALPLMEFFEV
jgi:hypothetical protein